MHHVSDVKFRLVETSEDGRNRHRTCWCKRVALQVWLWRVTVYEKTPK